MAFFQSNGTTDWEILILNNVHIWKQIILDDIDNSLESNLSISILLLLDRVPNNFLVRSRSMFWKWKVYILVGLSKEESCY